MSDDEVEVVPINPTELDDHEEGVDDDAPEHQE